MTPNEVGQIVNDQADATRGPWADYDNDGWPDVWVMTQFSATNVLYHNDRGFFRKVTTGSIAEQHAAYGAAWGDYDNDGFLDLFATGFAFEGVDGGPHALHRNLGGLTFTNVAASSGIPSTHRGLGAGWADYDNDGFLDLYLTAGSPYTSLLLQNNGDGTFTSVDVGGPIHDSAGFSRYGFGCTDYNNDGFLDLAVGCDGTPNLFFHNNGNTNHWLKVRLTGTASNRSAIGAKVRVKASIRGKEMWQMREISGNSSVAGGSAGLLAHFGLGDAAQVETLRIEWPSGTVQELESVDANQHLTMTEPPRLLPQSAGGFRIQCWINQSYDVEASTDLATWSSVATVTNLTGTLVFEDVEAGQHDSRYYRVVAE